ncbi:MAG: hypothetical protein JKY48_09140 [Flavobacteriales bacterium]|nr:hypothetical protein [Flavobacteriales bacterium]
MEKTSTIINAAIHTEELATQAMYQIPFIFWKSNSYTKQNFNKVLDPEREYSSEDLLYTMADLANIRFNSFDPTRNVLIELKDKILLRIRSVIETVNDELKNMRQIEHSKHRSFSGFISNIIAALIEYSFFDKNLLLNSRAA